MPLRPLAENHYHDVNLLRVAIRQETGVPRRRAGGNCGTDRGPGRRTGPA